MDINELVFNLLEESPFFSGYGRVWNPDPKDPTLLHPLKRLGDPKTLGPTRYKALDAPPPLSRMGNRSSGLPWGIETQKSQNQKSQMQMNFRQKVKTPIDNFALESSFNFSKKNRNCLTCKQN